MDPEPVRVRSGAFQVDRKRMLEKLAQFKAPDSKGCALAWLRAAVAAAGTRIAVTSFSTALELRFDGRPFSELELEEPFGALFDEEAHPAYRFLAFGLLGACGQGAATVSIVSGKGSGRRELVATGLKDYSTRPAEQPGSDTRIHLRGLAEGQGDRLAAWIEERCLLAPVPITVNERLLAPYPGETPREAVAFEADGIRGRLQPYLPPDGRSRGRLYVYGVGVENALLDAGPAAVWAEVNDDRLALDASHARIARNDRFRLVQGMVREAAQTLHQQVASGHRRQLRTAGKSLARDERLARAWRQGLGDAAGDEKPGFLEQVLAALGAARPGAGGRDEASFAAVRKTASRTRWLREASERGLQGWSKRAAKPSEAWKPLWTAPLFLSWKARPLSLLELRTTLERTGHVAWAQAPLRVDVPAADAVVWAVCPQDRHALQRLFPDASLVFSATPGRL
ncbi:MAG: hypothetical protein HY554_09385 [Elusimicrobia bacterium]|nr:hypothetical protein [Elusimicrobiota bacterium]